MNNRKFNSRRTLWLVNNEPCVLEALGTIIRQGFPDVDLVEFPGGQAAWTALQTGQPDLLVTGDVMCDLRGSELVERLHQRGDTFPIVVTSAYLPTSEWVDASAARGMKILFLEVPMSVGQLLDVIHRAWDEPLEC